MVMVYEKALLNGMHLTLTDNVRLYVITCVVTMMIMFIGYVNKLRSNYSNL